MSFWTSIENWFTADVEPYFKSVVASEVKALAPIAQTAVTSLATEEVAALAAGGANTGHVLAKVVAQTATAAEAAGISAAASSVLTAVGNAAVIAGAK